VNERIKELINLAENSAINLTRKERNINPNFIKRIAEQIQRSGFNMIKHITEAELENIRTKSEINNWVLVIEELKKMIKEKKLTEDESPLFLGYLAREITFLSVSLNTNNSPKQNKNFPRKGYEHKGAREKQKSNYFANKLQEALKESDKS